MDGQARPVLRLIFAWLHNQTMRVSGQHCNKHERNLSHVTLKFVQQALQLITFTPDFDKLFFTATTTVTNLQFTANYC